jgi:hypothetical protein
MQYKYSPGINLWCLVPNTSNEPRPTSFSTFSTTFVRMMPTRALTLSATVNLGNTVGLLSEAVWYRSCSGSLNPAPLSGRSVYGCRKVRNVKAEEAYAFHAQQLLPYISG